VFGVDPSRLVLSPQAPWIDHLPTKTAIDMILDTPSKNGHTTGPSSSLLLLIK
jgi:predicted O-linked N-acetylglucosamine transferase (SPINDLY family)